jgi:hypothetical protein
MSYFDRFTPEYWDHERDLRKHDTPSRHQPAHRLDTAIPTAVDIAVLVRNPTVKLTDAADLIEQYARAMASEARLDGMVEGSDKVLSAIERHTKVPA